MKTLFLLLWITLFTNSCISQLIPKPNAFELISTNKFELKDNYTIYYSNDSLKSELDFLTSHITLLANFKFTLIDLSKLPLIKINPNSIYVYSNKTIPKEGYELKIDSIAISLTANDKAGLFYGIQSLIQLLPYKKTNSLIYLPNVKIVDQPRFEWRGMHLDVCRHFFPKEFIKKYIDFLAMYKMNVFHWHLTEDQGWRIAIEKYPKLTEIGSVRKGSMVGPYNNHHIDSVRYGGYYSQEEIKDVVAYASLRHITIVPEIEMPGHSLAALAAYPELSCTGGRFEVAKEWGVFDDVYCAGSEKTFEFLENVLDEVCKLFPGKYIHIGGDECPKTRWESCPKCQNRMNDNGLKNEHELQSYFIQRIEKYLNTKGKQIIGWDEILEGGLAPNAAVMSWRGVDGGIEAAKQKHKVVMTPGSHCYFDHYQGNPHSEPHAIGGYTTLQKVYSYDPIPAELKNESKSFILGAQGNVWTEYISSASQVEYMVFPRICALAEILWTQVENKNEKDFMSRISKHISILDSKNINYSTAFLEPNITTKKSNKGIDVEITKPSLNGTLNYIANTKVKYKDLKMKSSKADVTKLHINKSCEIFTNFILNDSVSSHIKWNKLKIDISKATSATVTYQKQPSEAYNTNSDFTLVNGIRAGLPKVNSEWLAWSGEDVEITVSFIKKQKVKSVEIGYLVNNDNWIYKPEEFQITSSTDGITFKKTSELSLKRAAKRPKKLLYVKELSNYQDSYLLNFKKTKAKHIKIQIKNPGKIPEKKPGAGEKCWMFFDEIIIN